MILAQGLAGSAGGPDAQPAVSFTPKFGGEGPRDVVSARRILGRVMPLSAKDIQTAFTALAEELAREGQTAELVIAGGAALVLLYEARETTKDVDAYFLSPETSVIRGAASRVAERLALPTDWLNDGAKGYFVGVTKGEVLYSSAALVVRAASVEQLLAMKLAAWRDAIDRSDAKLLLSHISGSFEEVWATLRIFVPPHQLDKASYALEDLWETLHGSR